LDNNRMIRIVSGLAEGEVVLLDPPLKASSVEGVPAGRAEPNAAGAKSDGVDEQVRSRLTAARKAGGGVPTPGPAAQPPSAGSSSGPAPQPGADLKPAAPGPVPPGMPKLTPEQQKKMQEAQEAFQKMTPEQRQQAMEKAQKVMKVMQSLSAEEKQKLQSMSLEEQKEFFKQKMGGDLPQ
jgi:hypothetical protein